MNIRLTFQEYENIYLEYLLFWIKPLFVNYWPHDKFVEKIFRVPMNIILKI